MTGEGEAPRNRGSSDCVWVEAKEHWWSGLGFLAVFFVPIRSSTRVRTQHGEPWQAWQEKSASGCWGKIKSWQVSRSGQGHRIIIIAAWLHCSYPLLLSIALIKKTVSISSLDALKMCYIVPPTHDRQCHPTRKTRQTPNATLKRIRLLLTLPIPCPRRRGKDRRFPL